MKQINHSRKWPALLTALCMVMTMLPGVTVVAAAENFLNAVSHRHPICECGAGDPCDHPAVAFSPLPESVELTESGDYYLTGDVTEQPLIVSGANTSVRLCLNGHELAAGIRVGDGGSITICDCSEKETGHINADWYTPAVRLGVGSSAVLCSGKLSGSPVEGSVSGGEESSFTMYGGTLENGISLCANVTVTGGTMNQIDSKENGKSISLKTVP